MAVTEPHDPSPRLCASPRSGGFLVGANIAKLSIAGMQRSCFHPALTMESSKFVYSFAVWPDETWHFDPAVHRIFEAIGGRVEFEFSETDGPYFVVEKPDQAD